MKLKITDNILVKFSLVFLVISALLLALNGVYYHSTLKDDAKENLIRNAQAILVANSELVKLSLKTNNDILLLGAIENIEKIENVEYCYTLNEQGRVVGASNVYEIGKVYEDRQTKIALTNNKFNSTEYNDSMGLIIDCSLPVEDAGVKIAVMRLGFNYKTLAVRVKDKMTKYIIFSGSFMLLNMFVMLFFVRNKISKPLRILQEGIALASKGFQDVKMSTKSNDEVGKMFVAVHDFMQKMKKEIGRRDMDKKEWSALEEERLEKAAELFAKQKKVIIADGDNKILYSNFQPSELFPAQEMQNINVSGMHLLDLVKDGKLLELYNQAYAHKDEIHRSDVAFWGGEYRAGILVLSGKRVLEPKTMISLEKE